MKTPAERVQEQMDKMMKGIPFILKQSERLQKAYGEALLNALQTLVNFKEVERLTRNIEKLN